MKKCNGCDQEIDKYAIACEYCGKLSKEQEKSDESKFESDSLSEKNSEDTKEESDRK